MVSSFRRQVKLKMLIFCTMTNSTNKIQRFRIKADSSLHEKKDVQQVLAQREATLLRQEGQKVKEKSQER